MTTTMMMIIPDYLRQRRGAKFGGGSLSQPFTQIEEERRILSVVRSHKDGIRLLVLM